MTTVLVALTISAAVVGVGLLLIAVSINREIRRVEARSENTRTFGSMARNPEYVVRP